MCISSLDLSCKLFQHISGCWLQFGNILMTRRLQVLQSFCACCHAPPGLWYLQRVLTIGCCRYRQKRHERNFTKRIKYMCRKTLADTRPRVRGRFARNNDAGAVMPHETKKALAAKAKAGKVAAAAQGQHMAGTSQLHFLVFYVSLEHFVL